MKKIETQALGELESRVMELVWQLGPVSVRDVLNNINCCDRKLAYTTIMTVMSRLYEKGVLKRKVKNDAYIYTAAQDRKSFIESISKKIIDNLINRFGADVAVAGFMDVIEVSDKKTSKELCKKLKEIID